MDPMGDDIQLMADSCSALLRLLYGENNWSRWNEIKQQHQLDTQGFMSWLLDLAEQQTNSHFKQLDEECSTGENAEALCDEPGLPSQDSYNVYELTTAAGSSSVGGVWENDEDVAVIEDPYLVKQEVECPVEQSAPTQLQQHTLFVRDDVANSSQTTDQNTLDIRAESIRGPFYCMLCQVSLSDIEVLKEHRNLRHQTEGLQMSCQCCQQVYQSVSGYVDYHRQSAIQMGHAGTSSRHICHLCAKSFARKQHLSDHVANTHQKVAPKHECPYCGKKISHASNVSKHKRKCRMAPTNYA